MAQRTVLYLGEINDMGKSEDEPKLEGFDLVM